MNIKKEYEKFFERKRNDLCVHDAEDVISFAKYCQALQLQQINIIQSICEESVIVFTEWLRENCYDTGNKWLYQKNDELYTSKEIYEVYKKECSETVA